MWQMATSAYLFCKKIQIRNSKIHFFTSIDHRFEVFQNRTLQRVAEHQQQKYYRIFVFLKDYSNYSLSFKNNKCVLRASLNLILSFLFFLLFSCRLFLRLFALVFFDISTTKIYLRTQILFGKLELSGWNRIKKQQRERSEWANFLWDVKKIVLIVLRFQKTLLLLVEAFANAFQIFGSCSGGSCAPATCADHGSTNFMWYKILRKVFFWKKD